MKKEAKKVTIKVDKIVATYQILAMSSTPEKKGINISDLDTADMYKVIRAVNAFKPVAIAYEEFKRDAAERLKPANWSEIVKMAERFKELSDGEKMTVKKADAEYSAMVDECVLTELAKDKEIDAYEHLSKEAFGMLVKSNGHILDVRAVMLLQEMIG